MPKIMGQKSGSWNESDRLQLATLLIKAGYKVRIGKEKTTGKTSIIFVEYEEQEGE